MTIDDISELFVLSIARSSKHFRQLEKDRLIAKTLIQVLSKDGYLSIIYHVTVFFDDNSSFSFVLKRPSTARYIEAFCLDIEKDDLNFLSLVHNRECQVYDIFKDQISIAPRIYGAKQIVEVAKDTGYLMMESLVGRAGVLGMFGQITDKLCLNMANQLGKFKAEMAEVPLESYAHLSDPFRLESDLLYNLMIDHTPTLVEYDYKVFFPLTQKLKPFVNKKSFAYLIKTRAEELGVESLIHGDLHGGNLMLILQSDGTLSNEIAAIIDWQLSFCGNPLFDLARFLSCADPDIRRRVEKAAIDEYFNAYLRHVEYPNPRFTREVCQELYDLSTVLQALEWQNFFGILTGNLNVSKSELEAIKARTALKCRFCMEDSLLLIEKYKLHEKIDSSL